MVVIIIGIVGFILATIYALFAAWYAFSCWKELDRFGKVFFTALFITLLVAMFFTILPLILAII